MDTNNFNLYNYVDHIFVINYINNNRYESLCNELLNVNIDVHKLPISKFTFINDYENTLLYNYINLNDIINNVHEQIQPISKYYFIVDKKYVKVGFNTYKILKIAEYMNYERILILEDDIKFLKDLKYLDDALSDLNNSYNSSFDMMLGQGDYRFNDDIQNTFDISVNKYYIKMTQYTDISSYGGVFIILSKEGIKKIINVMESYKLPIVLDTIQLIKDNNLDILSVKKPLAIQDGYFYDNNEDLNKLINPYMNINEYKWILKNINYDTFYIYWSWYKIFIFKIW